MPLLSIITTCKGRLDHLKQTLPSWMSLRDCECVVVDYDCPQGTSDWVRKTYPTAKVVQVADRPSFNLAKVHNLGAGSASAPWFLFIDADMGTNSSDLIEVVRPLLSPGHFFVPSPRPPEAWGTVIVSREDFKRLEGYDEVFEGWGGEDDDFTWRLSKLGSRLATFSGTLLRPLPHADAVRTQYHEIRDRDLNQAINALYITAKRDLIRLEIPIDIELRKRLYQDFRRRLLSRESPHTKSKIQLGVRRSGVGIWSIYTSLHYELTVANTADKLQQAGSRQTDE
jgi:glycosyltransferase involved in cell wall biosynthesis